MLDPDQTRCLMPGQFEELPASAGLKLRCSTDLTARKLPHLDVTYINAIAWVGDSVSRCMGRRLSVDQAIMPYKPDGSIVLHPLGPRSRTEHLHG